MTADRPPASPRTLRHRLLRLLRDLRLSGMLAVLTLLPSAAVRQVATPVKPQQPDGGDVHIIHVPGIAGPLRIDRHMAEGLLAGGAVGEVEIFDWVGGRRGFKALFGVDEN